MKAIVFTRYGSPDGLAMKEVPKPEPGDDELLIRVHASSINSWDWEFLNGKPFINRLFYGLLKPGRRKQILGSDVSGTVEAIGKAVKRFQPGDEVFGDLWDNWGGFAEYACAQETSFELKPPQATFAEAACVPQAGVLALQGLLKGGQLKPGQKVLINGAGGGVGTFAVQIARLWGAEVTGVDASHKLDIIRSLGADHVIDFNQDDFTKTGECYDLVVDCQNFRSMFDHKRALNPGGTYAMIGGSIPRVYQLWLLDAIGRLIRDDRRLCLVAEGPNKGLSDLRDLVEADKLVPVIDSSYLLSEVPEALRYFGEGKHKGKIAIVAET
jgi:NADPH:quinone reductase-like Zn-dependent oxidoreductase